MVTVVPELALSGWEGLVTFDAGVGAGFFSNYKFGMQDFGGPVQIVATVGVRVNPFSSRLCRISCPTLLRCRRCTDPPVSAWTCTSWSSDTNFDTSGNGVTSPARLDKRATALRLPP